MQTLHREKILKNKNMIKSHEQEQSHNHQINEEIKTTVE